LARAVRPEDAAPLSGSHVEVDFPDGEQAAEAPADPPQTEDRPDFWCFELRFAQALLDQLARHDAVLDDLDLSLPRRLRLPACRLGTAWRRAGLREETAERLRHVRNEANDRGCQL